jgi:hypothetical protein
VSAIAGDDVTAAAWEKLALFESTDLVRTFYGRRHDRELNLRDARAIVSHVSQGREYFAASERSGELVKPVLQYYGALSLARGAVLYLDKRLREPALAKSHGVSEMGWAKTLSEPIVVVGNISVRIDSSGTLAQFMTATENEERTTVEVTGDKDWALPTLRTIHRLRIVTPVANTVVTLKQLLARLPGLATVFEETYQERTACYQARVRYHANMKQADIEISAAADMALPAVETVRRSLLLPDDASVAYNPLDRQRGSLPHISVVLTNVSLDDVSRRLPPMHISDEGDFFEERHFLVEPLPSGVVLPPPAQLFVIAHTLGTLARYYPTAWLALLSRHAGDRELPLIRAASAAIEVQFPGLVWRLIEPDHIDSPESGSDPR